MGKPRDEKSEATNTHISSSTIGNSKQAIEKSNEHPEWLPGGWNVWTSENSKKWCKYGSWCYIAPSGHKFYSKPEVLRYLETVNSYSHTSKKEKICKSNVFEDSVDNGHARISETDISPKNKLAENVTGISNDKNSRVNSKKSKNKKELTMPRRLSQRLAGHEPEVLLTEKAIKYATRKFCNDKPATTEILTNGVSGHLHIREESKLVLQASDRLKTLYGESSSKSDKSYDPQTVPNEQLQRLEAENVADDRSDPLFPTPFGDWSHPCLEFEIETLSGALLVDAPTATAAAGILPVMTPDVNAPANKELLDNPNQSQTKKEFSTVCKPSNKFWTSSS
ncbi:hypothetical protein JHK85_002579 [Glycine max]|nr:hypothetical protein JHK85_002579 [Glycine max]